MAYAYKDGFREGVVFAFIGGDKLLIEHRPLDNGATEVFIPNGSIEDFDKTSTNDYKIVALKREIEEEFSAKIEAKSICDAGEVKVKEINVIFYVYAITAWKGKFPEYTVEKGRRYARLEWINFNEIEKYFEFKSAFQICELLKEYISIEGGK